MCRVSYQVFPPFLKMCLSFFFLVLKPKKSVCLLDLSFHILTEKMVAKRPDDRNLVSFPVFYKESFSRLKLQLEKIKLTFTKS